MKHYYVINTNKPGVFIEAKFKAAFDALDFIMDYGWEIIPQPGWWYKSAVDTGVVCFFVR